mgnify:CR=1 FL=1
MTHDYTSHVVWTGNRGEGTAHYRAYDRTWDVAVPGKAVIHCSNDPLLGGDPGKMNPEDLLLSALAACPAVVVVRAVTEACGFGKTSGMIDDTRAFCSIPARHDMMRRLDAAHLANLVAVHRLDEDEAIAQAIKLVDDNPKKVFNL